MALAKIARFLIKLTHNVFYMCAAAAMYFLDLSFQLVRLANYLANKTNLIFVEKTWFCGLFLISRFLTFQNLQKYIPTKQKNYLIVWHHLYSIR